MIPAGERDRRLGHERQRLVGRVVLGRDHERRALHERAHLAPPPPGRRTRPAATRCRRTRPGSPARAPGGRAPRASARLASRAVAPDLVHDVREQQRPARRRAPPRPAARAPTRRVRRRLVEPGPVGARRPPAPRSTPSSSSALAAALRAHRPRPDRQERRAGTARAPPSTAAARCRRRARPRAGPRRGTPRGAAPGSRSGQPTPSVVRHRRVAHQQPGHRRRRAGAPLPVDLDVSVARRVRLALLARVREDLDLELDVRGQRAQNARFISSSPMLPAPWPLRSGRSGEGTPFVSILTEEGAALHAPDGDIDPKPWWPRPVKGPDGVHSARRRGGLATPTRAASAP